MRRKIINGQVLVELACYVIFASALLFLLLSGKYLSYVTPKMKPYLYFAVVVMILWAVLSVFGLFRLQYRKRMAHCLVLLIPVFLLLLPHEAMGMSNLSGSTGLLTGSSLSSPVGSGKKTGNQAAVPAASKPTPSASAASTPPKASQEPSQSASENVSSSSSSEPFGDKAPASEPADGGGEDTAAPAEPAPKPAGTGTYMGENAYGDPVELHGYDAANKTITVSNDEFYDWACEFFTKMDEFAGFQITMTGSVYKDAVFTPNQFVPARLVMSCCVADLAPSGIVCTYDKAPGLKSDQWVTVTGTLYIGQFEGLDEPMIQVTSVVPADPVEGYIYPFS